MKILEIFQHIQKVKEDICNRILFLYNTAAERQSLLFSDVLKKPTLTVREIIFIIQGKNQK